jgi:hypothetical protein
MVTVTRRRRGFLFPLRRPGAGLGVVKSAVVGSAAARLIHAARRRHLQDPIA